MVTSILFAAITALVMCFVASLIEDLSLPHHRRKPGKYTNGTAQKTESQDQ